MTPTIKDSNKSILIFLLFSVLCYSIFFSLRHVLNENFDMMDHMWNYNLSAKISLGFIPYHDFNLLQTPFSFYITALFLFILGNSYYVYAVMGGILITLMYYLLYRVALKLTHHVKASIYVTFICLIFTIPNLMIYNYNILSIILVLLILLFELNNRSNFSNHAGIGFLLGLLFLTKQNISIGVIGFSYLFIVISNDLTIRDKVKIIFMRSTFAVLPVIFYCFYLYSNNALYDFVDHAFLGMLDFQQDNAFEFPLIESLYFFLPLFLILRSVYILIKTKNFQFTGKLAIILPYTLGMLFTIYPLFDLNHISIASVTAFLLLPIIYKPENLGFSSMSRVVFLAILPVMLIYHVIYVFSGNFTLFTLADNYKYTVVHQEQLKHISTMQEYLKKETREGKYIVILDTRAMAYWSMLGVYNDPFDFLVAGNLGYKGASKVQTKIDVLEPGTLFMISDIPRMQEMVALRAHVICHYKYVEQVSIYKVYQKTASIIDNPACVKDSISNQLNMIKME